jgi:hypothetical protein
MINVLLIVLVLSVDHKAFVQYFFELSLWSLQKTFLYKNFVAVGFLLGRKQQAQQQSVLF